MTMPAVALSDIPEGFQIKKLKDLGARLPIGVLREGVLLKDFSLREYFSPLEKAFGKWKVEHAADPNSTHLTKLLALLLTKLGGESFLHNPDDDPPDAAKEMYRISQCYMPDVIYMYVFARVQELGHELKYPIAHGCGYVGTADYDLRELEVVCCEDPSELLRSIQLVHGVKHGGEICKKAYVQPMKWYHMETPEAEEAQKDLTLMKLYLTERSMMLETKVKDEIVQVVPNELSLSTLRKLDTELLARGVSDLNLGARLVSEGKCPKCKEDFFQPMDWTYDNFFDESSLPGHPIRSGNSLRRSYGGLAAALPRSGWRR